MRDATRTVAPWLNLAMDHVLVFVGGPETAREKVGLDEKLHDGPNAKTFNQFTLRFDSDKEGIPRLEYFEE